MSLTALLPQVVTIIRYSPGTEDEYGNATRVAATPVDIRGRLEQVRSTETTIGQDTVLDRWRLFLPAGTAIDAGDEVTEGGRTFRVDGTPEQIYGAVSIHHVECLLTYSGDVA